MRVTPVVSDLLTHRVGWCEAAAGSARPPLSPAPPAASPSRRSGVDVCQLPEEGPRVLQEALIARVEAAIMTSVGPPLCGSASACGLSLLPIPPTWGSSSLPDCCPVGFRLQLEASDAETTASWQQLAQPCRGVSKALEQIPLTACNSTTPVTCWREV